MLGAAYYMLADHVRAPKHSNGPAQVAGVSTVQRKLNICLIYAPHRCSPDRSHWFAGNLDRAAAYAERTIEEAGEIEPSIALCRALI